MALQVDTKPLISSLKKRMEKFSKHQQFEMALVARNQINSIEWLNEKQNMERQRKYDEDIFQHNF